VHLFTIKQTVYSVKYTVLAYDIGILLWQHASVYLKPSSGQRSYAKDTISAYCVLCTVGSHTTYEDAKAIKNIIIFKG